MEFIAGIIILGYCLYDQWRDGRAAKKRPTGPWRIEADATIERDAAGQIRAIHVKLP